MRNFLMTVAAVAGSVLGSPALAQNVVNTAWTYQGQLKDGAALANGSYEFQFRLFPGSSGGTPIGTIGGTTPVTLAVNGGSFSTELNFGGPAFDGADRWLEVSVRPAGSGTFTVLPRQRIAAAPYSLYSNLSYSTRGMTVQADGRVGFGPLASGYRAIVSSSTQGELLELNSSNPNYTILTVNNTSSGGAAWALLSTGAGYGTGSGDLVFRNINAAQDRLVIGNDGNIGIGVAVAQAKLDVAGRVRAHELEITGGSDIAEPFTIASAGEVEPQPGMVVSIDAAQVGKLRVSSQAYDTAVAGIISGANGIKVGLTLTQENSIADGKLPVAAAGRVWCYVDADAAGPVKAGDLLTTSNTPGHAMRALPGQGNGAILGKAMSSLDSGKGMVLVLVGLQ